MEIGASRVTCTEVVGHEQPPEIRWDDHVEHVSAPATRFGGEEDLTLTEEAPPLPAPEDLHPILAGEITKTKL